MLSVNYKNKILIWRSYYFANLRTKTDSIPCILIFSIYMKQFNGIQL